VSGNIKVRQLQLGSGVFIHESAIICGADGGIADKVTIGDHSYIGENVQIRCAEFSLGDYSKIHHHTNVHGYKPCQIGHNAWIGQYCIIDSIGGTTIGDNCGIGAHSQLWSHIKYGDTLEGCNFLSDQPLQVGKDVWFVGHCIVSPIIAHDKSMAMVGSVITKDMVANTIYAGCPAKELSSKIGPQFRAVPIDEKFARLQHLLVESGLDAQRLRVVRTRDEVDFAAMDVSFFVVEDRTYTKRLSEPEVNFMKFLLPERAKFTPATP
jgi:acetyltransferase-like isoleucine patch superfamily enzyme